MKEQLYKTARIRMGLENAIPTDFKDGQYVAVKWYCKAYDEFTGEDANVYAVCPDTSFAPEKTSYLFEAALENFVL